MVRVLLAWLLLVFMVPASDGASLSIVPQPEAAGSAASFHHPIAPAGLLFFGYGADDVTARYYLGQAVISARRIKVLNPGTNITIVTNPGLEHELEDAFDMVILTDDQHIYEGHARSGSSPIHRQWLTRLIYMARSPYEVTLALDSQALCCATYVEDILNQLRWEEFDIAFAVQGPTNLAPHNWAIMYRQNFNTRRLFKRWEVLQHAYDRAGTDQLTLHVAAGTLALQGKLSVGVLSQNVAMATVIYDREVPQFPKSSTLIPPRPVHFVHYDAQSQEDEETTCAKINKDSNRARVVFLPKPFPRYQETQKRMENIYEVLYSEQELAEAANRARENHPYFRGLDWENESGKWGQASTPWHEYYPNCWDDLAEDVIAGVRHIYGHPRNPRNIWENTRFMEEFGGDHWVRPTKSTEQNRRYSHSHV